MSTERAPQRIEWLDDGAYLVERVHESEYATIVTVGNRKATQAEIDAWRFEHIEAAR